MNDPNKPKMKVEDKRFTPPIADQRWQIACNEYARKEREEKGTIARSAMVVVEARLWIEARAKAMQAFASEHHIYEPEDITAVLIRHAEPVAKKSAARPPAKRVKKTCAACGHSVGSATIVFGGQWGDAPCCANCFGLPQEQTDAMITARISSKETTSP